MPSLSFQPILDYRAQTFRTAAGRRIATKEEAIAFVNERGYVYFWPIKEVTLPSLWTAVAGDRPVPDEHDDPGHVTWGWKDEMLGARQWYYAKVLRKRATFISLDVAAQLLCALGELRRAGQGLPAAIPGRPADLGSEDGLRDDLERGGAGYRQPAQAGPHDHQGQRLALQPRAGDPPGGFQDPAGGHRAGGRVEIRLRLRVRPPPLPRPARSRREPSGRRRRGGIWSSSICARWARPACAISRCCSVGRRRRSPRRSTPWSKSAPRSRA